MPRLPGPPGGPAGANTRVLCERQTLIASLSWVVLSWPRAVLSHTCLKVAWVLSSAAWVPVGSQFVSYIPGTSLCPCLVSWTLKTIVSCFSAILVASSKNVNWVQLPHQKWKLIKPQLVFILYLVPSLSKSKYFRYLPCTPLLKRPDDRPPPTRSGVWLTPSPLGPEPQTPHDQALCRGTRGCGQGDRTHPPGRGGDG